MPHTQSEQRAIAHALFAAAAYFVFSGAYIVLSSVLATETADSVRQLGQLELVKGLLFVVATSGLLYALLRRLFRGLAREAVELTRSREALLGSERRALAGLFASSVAHDSNNMLAVVRNNLEVLLRSPRLDESEREAARESREALDRAAELLSRLWSAGRGSTGEPRAADLVAIVREALVLLRAHPSLRSCDVRVVAPEPVVMPVQRTLVHEALINLVLNAGEAMGGRGALEVRVVRDGTGGLVEVHDAGPGVPEDQREKIFEPFHTTKATGTGLGLMSVRTAAEAHGGSVAVDGSPLGGARFSLRLGGRGGSRAA